MPELAAGVNIELTINGSDLEVSSTALDINTQTGTTYTLVLADAGKLVTMENGSAQTVTIPTNASVAFPIGTTIAILGLGAGTVTIEGDTGVTVNGDVAGSVDISAQYGSVAIVKLGADTWNIVGSIDSGIIAAF